MTEITFEMTCMACPEQYWVHMGDKTIGYIRLRWGHLTCDYLPCGIPELTDYDVRVLDHIWEDDFKGCFENGDERNTWLDKCKDALMAEYIKRNKEDCVRFSGFNEEYMI